NLDVDDLVALPSLWRRLAGIRWRSNCSSARASSGISTRLGDSSTLVRSAVTQHLAPAEPRLMLLEPVRQYAREHRRADLDRAEQLCVYARESADMARGSRSVLLTPPAPSARELLRDAEVLRTRRGWRRLPAVVSRTAIRWPRPRHGLCDERNDTGL